MKDVDLNLLVIFDKIMTEGSVSKAAERLALTQSAVSNAVARMRVVWGDPMFVRDGRGVKPSAKARALWHEIQTPLSAIRIAATPTQFVPASSAQKFRLAVTDYLSSALWPSLRRHIEMWAPGICLYAVPYSGRDLHKQLTENAIDLSFGTLPFTREDIRVQSVFSEGWVCAMRRDHPLARKTLTLHGFLTADHLLVSFSGDPSGPVDVALEKMDARRKVAVTLTSFGGVPTLLLSSSLICVVPAGVIRTHALRGEIHTAPVPFELAPFHCHFAWHARNDRDAGQIWMRDLVAQTCKEIWNDYSGSRI